MPCVNKFWESDQRMDAFVGLLFICAAVSCFGSIHCFPPPASCNVLEFGAIGDGKADDTAAFLKAWSAVCGATSHYGNAVPTLVIPKGKKFALQQVEFGGPCRAGSVHVQISGVLVPFKVWRTCPPRGWISFSSVRNLFIDGSGTINGKGWIWWNKEKSSKGNVVADCTAPTALHFNECDGLRLSGLNHLDSPRNHISICSCKGVELSNLKIVAPEDSPNTDGVDISSSSQISIRDSFIGTGDDCVAINGGTSSVQIRNVVCGPGHGISVGSLGKNGEYDTVEDVYVSNVVFKGTMNGARIKTWQGGKGYARRITYENIKLINSKNPILIDQFYGNGEHDCPTKSSAVALSGVTYRNFVGTSASKAAITFNCSREVACSNIVLERINIKSKGGEEAYAFCRNVNGKSVSTNPFVPCLAKGH